MSKSQQANKKSSTMTRQAYRKRRLQIRMLTESAVMIALATVLSLIEIGGAYGGGVTLVSMLPIIVISHRWGWKHGVLTAAVYSVIQLLIGLKNVGYATTFAQAVGVVVLDYLAAFTVLGLSSLFEKPFGRTNKAVFWGILTTFSVRFLCHFISGVWIWGSYMENVYLGIPTPNVWVYSLVYNGWYMLLEIIITESVATILYQTLGKYFRGEDLYRRQ